MAAKQAKARVRVTLVIDQVVSYDQAEFEETKLDFLDQYIEELIADGIHIMPGLEGPEYEIDRIEVDPDVEVVA